MNRAFVTGHKGYIGCHLVEVLKSHGWYVKGCDLGLFNGCEWSQLTSPDLEINKDIRELKEQDVDGFDAIFHLAAISNDPMGDLDEGLTESVNLYGSIHVAEIAKNAGVPRYLFAGSCSVYGKGEHLDLDEKSSFNPVSVYADTKVKAEQIISKLADKNFSPSFLRNATAYGHSPMLRIDLVANNLLASAFARGEIEVLSDGSPWRPLVHCIDIARAFVAFAEAPRDIIHNKAINIGENKENYQVYQIVDFAKKLLPNSTINYSGKVVDDPRNYRVKFDLLYSLLPDFYLEFDVMGGMSKLLQELKEKNFCIKDFVDSRYVRLRRLSEILSKKGRGGFL